MDGIGETNLWARGKQSPGWSNYQTVTPAYIGTHRDTALVLQLLYLNFLSSEFSLQRNTFEQDLYQPHSLH